MKIYGKVMKEINSFLAGGYVGDMSASLLGQTFISQTIYLCRGH